MEVYSKFTKSLLNCCKSDDKSADTEKVFSNEEMNQEFHPENNYKKIHPCKN